MLVRVSAAFTSETRMEWWAVLTCPPLDPHLTPNIYIWGSIYNNIINDLAALFQLDPHDPHVFQGNTVFQ